MGLLKIVDKVETTLPTKGIRFEPRILFACGVQKYTLYAQSVFPDVHAAGKTGFEFVFGLRAENDDGLSTVSVLPAFAGRFFIIQYTL